MRRAGKLRLVARNGKIENQCNHWMLAIAFHKDFLHKGWMCVDCGEFFLNPKFDGYGAAICAFKLGADDIGERR